MQGQEEGGNFGAEGGDFGEEKITETREENFGGEFDERMEENPGGEFDGRTEENPSGDFGVKSGEGAGAVKPEVLAQVEAQVKPEKTAGKKAVAILAVACLVVVGVGVGVWWWRQGGRADETSGLERVDEEMLVPPLISEDVNNERIADIWKTYHAMQEKLDDITYMNDGIVIQGEKYEYNFEVISNNIFDYLNEIGDEDERNQATGAAIELFSGIGDLENAERLIEVVQEDNLSDGALLCYYQGMKAYYWRKDDVENAKKYIVLIQKLEETIINDSEVKE